MQITRRVYRDGEGEYLINGQLCRLKDIKDLFLGSGAGTDAYCIIEQGRVDVLLQASTKDRRTIFEEAAGISRFKAKKTETLRKLERVDQNLQRLQDIVDEVEKQLRSVKLQAAKAQRTRSTPTGCASCASRWACRNMASCSTSLAEEEAALAKLRASLEEKSRQAQAWQERLRELEAQLARHDESVRAARVRAGGRQTANCRRGNHPQPRSHALLESAARPGADARPHDRAEFPAGDARQRGARQAAQEVQQAEADCVVRRQEYAQHNDALQAAQQRPGGTSGRGASDQERAPGTDAPGGPAAERHRSASRPSSTTCAANRIGCEQKSTRAGEDLASLDGELNELAAADETLQQRLLTARQTLAERAPGTRTSPDSARGGPASRGRSARTPQRTGQPNRCAGGTRTQPRGPGYRAFAKSSQLVERPDPGPWATVLGLARPVPDRRLANMRRSSTWPWANGHNTFWSRTPTQLERALETHAEPFSGRVSFLPVDLPADGAARKSAAGRKASDRDPLPDHPGIVAAAGDLVHCDRPELADLPARLLNNTLIVKDLEAARALASETIGYRFVTLAGELLESDGALTVGVHQAESGLLSRKSELRELREQVVAIDERIVLAETELGGLRDKLRNLESRTASLQQEVDVLAEQASDLRSRLNQRRQHREGLQQEVVIGRKEISNIAQELQELETSWQNARHGGREAPNSALDNCKPNWISADQATRELEQTRMEQEQHASEARVALAKVEERLAAVQARLLQAEMDVEQRRQERSQGDQLLVAARNRLAESQKMMLEASTALNEWYVEKEEAERNLATFVAERDVLRSERQALAERSQAAQAVLADEREQAHARELTVSDLTHRRDTLVGRLARRLPARSGGALSREAGTRRPNRSPCWTRKPPARKSRNCVASWRGWAA